MFTLASAFALLSLACTSMTCGPGTEAHDGQCLPVDSRADGGTSDGGGSDGGSTDGGSPDGGSSDGGSSDGGASGEPRFAPFVDATLYPVARLGDIAEETGVSWYNLGFIVSASAGSCEASWGGYYGLDSGPDSWGEEGQYFLYDEIDRVRDLGGDVVVSFGGAAGVPLAVACTEVDDLVDQLRDVIDTLDLVVVDFDVEGAWLADAESVHRRNAAIAALQAELALADRRLEVWYTLPVLPSGLTPDGLALLADALDQGVEIAGVNVMTMDYGDGAAPEPAGRMGEYAIEAVTALHGQMISTWAAAGRSPSEAELWAAIGATPMIGLNDVLSETFDLEDAGQLRSFAEEAGMGLLSMWSVNRDHPCPDSSDVQLTCSSTSDQVADWEFMAVLDGG